MKSHTMEQKRYNGILFIGDPHVCSRPPGHRIDDFRLTVMGKLVFCLNIAQKEGLLPIILGDLFHIPRDNPNSLLVELMELFVPIYPWVLVGNHDKYEARFTMDVSLAVLGAAGVVRVISKPGPIDVVEVAGRRILIGGSPDWTPIPSEMPNNHGHHLTVWLTHHNLSFPDYEAGRYEMREILGVDIVVNGHIHTPKPPVQKGRTLWLNPGSIVRIARSPIAKTIQPAILKWIPGDDSYGLFERVPVPYRPFEEVFQPFGDVTNYDVDDMDESLFIKGLENLVMRKTTEGIGLKAFLEENLKSGDPVDDIIWELYRDVMKHVSNGHTIQYDDLPAAGRTIRNEGLDETGGTGENGKTAGIF